MSGEFNPPAPADLSSSFIDQLYGDLQSAIGAPVTTPQDEPNPTAPVTPGEAQLPARAIAQLREGEITEFSNGQRWTLRNGQPVRVN